MGTSTKVKKAKRLDKNTFSSLQVDKFVEEKNWDMLEAYVKMFIPVLNPEEVHPMLFLRIRMSRVVDLIKEKNFVDAEQYYQDHMHTFFGQIVAQEQVHRNATKADISDGLNHISKCLSTKKSTAHLYTSNLMTKVVVNDYMRLYLPNEIGYTLRKKKDDLWRFAFQLQSKSASKPTFRCLVCSLEIFSSATIKDLAEHLEECPRMTTVYVLELFEHYRDMKSLNNAQADSLALNTMQGKRAATKSSGADSTPPAGTSIPAEQQDILAEIRAEIAGVEVLQRDIEKEVEGVMTLHNTMGKKVVNIVGMQEKMGGIVKKLKGLASPGSSVPATVIATADSAATQENKGEQDQGNSAEIKDADESLHRFDVAYLENELMEEMQVNPPAPTYELMDVSEMADSFMTIDAAGQVFPNN